MDYYVLICCMLNPAYYHVIKGAYDMANVEPQYMGRLPKNEALGIIKCLSHVRASPASVDIREMSGKLIEVIKYE